MLSNSCKECVDHNLCGWSGGVNTGLIVLLAKDTGPIFHARSDVHWSMVRRTSRMVLILQGLVDEGSLFEGVESGRLVQGPSGVGAGEL